MADLRKVHKNISSVINTQKTNFFNLKIAQQNNGILIELKKEPHHISGQIKGEFPNRVLLKKLDMASINNLPNTFYFKFDTNGQKSNVSSY